jgi:tryptophanyl-tRNA synthetase
MIADPIRLFSAMCPNGTLHLGHYHGALRAWKKAQYEYDCMFMVADVHGLIRNIDSREGFAHNIHAMVIDWLAAGVDPSQATIFVQSRVPEHFELATLLGTLTPLSWLERVPNYKEIIDKLDHTDSHSYGLLGAPLLQASEIILYGAKYVLTDDSQVAIIELTREIARRFNHLFGREEGFEDKALESIKKLGHKKAELYESLLVRFQQEGDEEARERARFLLLDALNLAHGDRERLFAFLENKGKVFVHEPQIFPDKQPKVVGLDGKPMSVNANNTVNLREPAPIIASKIRSMVTDPARKRRTDPGTPTACPVWSLHQIYSTPEVCEWVETGCQSAGIGCLDCKQPLIDKINHEQQQLRDKARPYEDDPTLVRRIISDGCARARAIANDNLKLIKQAINLDY